MYAYLNSKRLSATTSNIICFLFAAAHCSSAGYHDNLQFWYSKPQTINARKAILRNSSDYYSRFRYVPDRTINFLDPAIKRSATTFGFRAWRATDDEKVGLGDAKDVDNQTTTQGINQNVTYEKEPQMNQNVTYEKEPQKQDEDENEISHGINPYEIAGQLKTILSQFPYAEVDIEVLGRTVSYNDILLFKISYTQPPKKPSFRANDNKFAQDPPEKKIVFIVHALSTMGLSKLSSLTDELYLKNLISYYIIHLDRFDIYLMPLANPDGLLQSKSVPYWNKNYSPQPLCAGVALDRNFAVAWNNSHGIASCSQRYPGPYSFSEPETRAVRDVFKRFSHKMVAYFHVHSGTYDADVFKGDAVLYPTGFSDSSFHYDKYIDIRAEIDESIKNANFNHLSVTVDTLYNWYGPVFGSSVDYASTVYGIPYAMELVMQIYEGPVAINQFQRRDLFSELDFHALVEVWSRVIEVIFTNLKNIYL